MRHKVRFRKLERVYLGRWSKIYPFPATAGNELFACLFYSAEYLSVAKVPSQPLLEDRGLVSSKTDSELSDFLLSVFLIQIHIRRQNPDCATLRRNREVMSCHEPVTDSDSTCIYRSSNYKCGTKSSFVWETRAFPPGSLVKIYLSCQFFSAESRPETEP